MIFAETPKAQSPLRAALTNAYRQNETEVVEHLLQHIKLSKQAKAEIKKTATQLVEAVRKERLGKSGIDSFMYQYDLSSEEGVALMCLAEALIRIPDKNTADSLIKDKITKADWGAHLGESESLFVNAATWGLMLTGKIFSKKETRPNVLKNAFKNLVERTSEPVVRKSLAQAMQILGKQFVMGRDIKEGIKRAQALEQQGYLYSYDMLGEAARTAQDAQDYFDAYQRAIAAIGQAAKSTDPRKNPGISVKLSALHPRYEFSQAKRAIAEVTPRLKTLAIQAKNANIGLTIDAEEANRLDLSLDIIERVYSDDALNGWEGFGLALQSYQKRAWYLIDWLVDLAKKHKRRWMVRLIKGAYWDSEIKVSQEFGFEGYPVYTRKMNTDVSFLACAQKILKNTEEIYPQFATHNAHSVASILTMAGDYEDYEFQCLHGMGQALYDQIVGPKKFNKPCRIYAPVGSHEDLLPYLVRRLLENGANSSFVNRIVDSSQPVADIVADPMDKVKNLKSIPHPSIPLPANIYGEQRKNSHGIDLSNIHHTLALKEKMEEAVNNKWQAAPTNIKKPQGKKQFIYNPCDRQEEVGHVVEATADELKELLDGADKAAFAWDKTDVNQRASLLEKAADLFEEHHGELMALLVREAGKSIPDALSEVREAVDFCRYYAVQARKHCLTASELPGPTGELNLLQLHGRGPIICISPWNFPLAIFTGQVTAALVTGNPVLAKPANQTSLVAAKAVALLHQAGIPKDVLQLIPAKGSLVGKQLIPDPRIKGVVFTGSTETAQVINQTLANREGPIVPFIAETGGQNAMIVDSSALPEQVVVDVIASAFNSAGQRCSALRVLFVQEDIADKLLKMLKGAMAELTLGDPGLLNTDIGPVIDKASQETLQAHADSMHQAGKLLYQIPMSKSLEQGTFFGPCAFEIADINILTREVFGPILHIIRFKAKDLDKVINDINSTGYGLTLGIHTRVEETASYIQTRVRAGNCYVNRNMMGAVVGVQPFGGEGLSGTGPKAGGPHYLLRLCNERTLSINTAAAGGNASLMTLEDDAEVC